MGEAPADRPLRVPRIDDRGLDFSKLDEITPEEIAEFRRSYTAEDGRPHVAFEFLIENRPSILKRYRLFATYLSPPFGNARLISALSLGFMSFYGLLGFEPGILYCLISLHRAGFSRAEVFEALELPFLTCGPRGLQTIAQALDGYEWPPDPCEPVGWDGGWAADPGALSSGVDPATRQVLPGEVDKIVGWYERTLGEVPPYVRYLARFNQPALKAWRIRWEHALPTLPKQLLPMTLLTAACLHGEAADIRENVLLARAFGVHLDELRLALETCAVYGPGKLSTVMSAAGDILEAWPAG
jgi:hypothetical protein